MGKPVNVIGNINLGGISDSEYQGSANSVFQTSCLDIHSKPGVIRANQALKKIDNTDSLGIASVACSDGAVYTFHTSGKIYKVDPEAVTATVATDIGSALLDAIEFDGYIYYATPLTLGRVAVPSSGLIDWSTKVNNFANFSNGSTTAHPMIEQNLILYIGDMNYVAQVDSTTGTHVFTGNALDLRKEYTITCLGRSGNDLLIGATKRGQEAQCGAFTWNTTGVSFTTSDIIPESSINSILAIDNYVIVQAGGKGNLYVFDGNTMSRTKRMQGDWGYKNAMTVKKNASTSLYGLPLFGVSNIEGNPMVQGIYSYGAWSSGYPNVLNHEYNISTGNTHDITIGSLITLEDNIIVTWQDGELCGIDMIDWQNKAPVASFETRKIQGARIEESVSGFKIAWKRKPLGTQIRLFTRENETYEREIELTPDIKRQLDITKTAISETTTLQVRVELHANKNDSPEIELLIPILK